MTTNNAAQTTLGYINRRYGSDVRSKEVFKQGEKYYAVEVEKRPGSVKPDFLPGGFIGHVTNAREVWDNGIVVRTGVPFEIECRKGVWGYKEFCGKEYHSSKAFVDRTINLFEERGLKYEVIDESNGVITHFAYKPTKNGNKRVKFVKLGELEPKCKYFYDYNF